MGFKSTNYVERPAVNTPFHVNYFAIKPCQWQVPHTSPQAQIFFTIKPTSEPCATQLQHQHNVASMSKSTPHQHNTNVFFIKPISTPTSIQCQQSMQCHHLHCRNNKSASSHNLRTMSSVLFAFTPINAMSICFLLQHLRS